MKYRESKIDIDLRNWFTQDNSKALLRKIKLEKGSIRGINNLELDLSYPLVAIVGRNGSGKSTVLAMACCAFHNSDKGFLPARRKTTYYTFSDFFIQHPNEAAPSGITIKYEIAHNKWKPTDKMPDGIGIGLQARIKKAGGKWNDYSKRVKRNVVFVGIERIVPHSERSQSKSYSKAFKETIIKGWEDKVKESVGYILCKSYDEFKYLEYSKYSLPIVKHKDIYYSGFNMGAGENALFEIFTTIYSCGKGALIVIDEIELGLHAEAQHRFMNKLKEVSLEMQTQVIFTTHSRDVLDCLPYDARYFIENINGKTKITDSVSSAFVFSKLSSKNICETQLFVEDDVAKILLQTILPHTIRSRVLIDTIGSASALSRQLAAHYIHNQGCPAMAIFDGDQKRKSSSNRVYARKMVENPEGDFNEWFDSHSEYFPGDTWPEYWLVNSALSQPGRLPDLLSIDSDTLIPILEQGLHAGKHREFHEIASRIGLDRTTCIQHFCSSVTMQNTEQFEYINQHIMKLLNT